MSILQRYKFHSYTNEYIGILFREYDKPKFVYNSNILDYGNNIQCVFIEKEGKITFKGSSGKDSELEVILPINKNTMKLYNEINSQLNLDISKVREYLKEYTIEEQLDFISTESFFNKFEDCYLEISKINKNFVYNEKSNLTKEELVKFIEDFRKKFVNNVEYSWRNYGYHSYSDKFLAKNNDINFLYFFKFIKENTTQSEQAFYQNATSNPLLVKKLVRKHTEKYIENLLEGVLLNTAYGELTINCEGLLEFATHRPKLYKLLHNITYIKPSKQQVI